MEASVKAAAAEAMRALAPAMQLKLAPGYITETPVKSLLVKSVPGVKAPAAVLLLQTTRFGPATAGSLPTTVPPAATPQHVESTAPQKVSVSETNVHAVPFGFGVTGSASALTTATRATNFIILINSYLINNYKLKR